MTCCGKNDFEPNEVQTDPFGGMKDLKSVDKIALIVRIQKQFRGFMSRKRVKRLRETGGHHTMPRSSMGPDGTFNYDNPDVLVPNLLF